MAVVVWWRGVEVVAVAESLIPCDLSQPRTRTGYFDTEKDKKRADGEQMRCLDV